MFARFDGERFIPLKIDSETGGLSDNPEYEAIPVPVENNCPPPVKGEIRPVKGEIRMVLVRKKQTTENPPLLPNRPADFAKIENRARQAANGYGADVTINGYVYAKDVMVLLRYVEQLEGCLNKSINPESDLF